MTGQAHEGTRALQAGAGWRKSSRSSNNGNGANCVEARAAGDSFELRDSKLSDRSPRFPLSASAFDALLTGIKTGEIE